MPLCVILLNNYTICLKNQITYHIINSVVYRHKKSKRYLLEQKRLLGCVCLYNVFAMERNRRSQELLNYFTKKEKVPFPFCSCFM